MFVVVVFVILSVIAYLLSSCRDGGIVRIIADNGSFERGVVAHLLSSRDFEYAAAPLMLQQLRGWRHAGRLIFFHPC